MRPPRDLGFWGGDPWRQHSALALAIRQPSAASGGYQEWRGPEVREEVQGVHSLVQEGLTLTQWQRGREGSSSQTSLQRRVREKGGGFLERTARVEALGPS